MFALRLPVSQSAVAPYAQISLLTFRSVGRSEKLTGEGSPLHTTSRLLCHSPNYSSCSPLDPQQCCGTTAAFARVPRVDRPGLQLPARTGAAAAARSRSVLSSCPCRCGGVPSETSLGLVQSTEPALRRVRPGEPREYLYPGSFTRIKKISGLFLYSIKPPYCRTLYPQLLELLYWLIPHV